MDPLQRSHAKTHCQASFALFGGAQALSSKLALPRSSWQISMRFVALEMVV